MLRASKHAVKIQEVFKEECTREGERTVPTVVRSMLRVINKSQRVPQFSDEINVRRRSQIAEQVQARLSSTDVQRERVEAVL